jgi:hypothetical protein
VEVGALVNLRSLDASFNRLVHVPTEVGRLVRLEELVLNDNHLTRLPLSVDRRLSALGRLSVQYNTLEALPRNLRTITSLTVLDVRGNPFLPPSAQEASPNPVLVLNALTHHKASLAGGGGGGGEGSGGEGGDGRIGGRAGGSEGHRISPSCSRRENRGRERARARGGNGRQWSDASAPEVTAACGGTERGDEPECAGVGMLESRQRKYVARGDLGGGVRAGHTHTHTEREREALLEDGHDFEDDEDDVGIVRRLLLRRR